MASVYIKASPETFDAIVVGSGITGGWAAKELTERGLKTLMVERGRPVEHGVDYIGENKDPWTMPNRGLVDHKLAEEQYFNQRMCYAFDEHTKHFFNNDRDMPYSTPEGRPFSWIRGNQLGGKSLMWARQSYRWSDLDFEANLKDGHGVDWPIRYADLAPWYSHVERHVGISGTSEGLSVLPDSEFLPAFDFNSVELALKKKFDAKYAPARMIMGRTANLRTPGETQLAQGRGQCQARSQCHRGCSFGAYFSTQSSTLPAALKTGRLSIATDSIVHSVIYDPKTNRATGVRVIDANTLETREYHAKVVMLCASTLASTAILLNSTSEAYPAGLANSSGVLGHYLMDHLFGAGASGRIEGFEDDYYQGRRPTGPYIPRFRNVLDKHPAFLRGYALAGGAGREGWQSAAHRPGFGKDFKAMIRKPGPWRFGLGGQGEMLPRYENMVSLHPTKKDKWGMPLLHIDCSYSDNDRKMQEDIANTAANILEALGVKDVRRHTKTLEEWPPGLSIHEMGTARMGRDPKTSVLNGFNQAHDVPNLFVTDGASMASSAWQNPSLTFMALTARACAYAVDELKAGRI
ncbi:choline dehydrogenase-like flavoprotein [Pseudoduganella flava]|uniref:Choline dehydrogenase-like flavoprotein n=1 Tax=Pseudoduganella flava TaxID=871742 RepID=A0A562Q216_9BURK|nr:GMC family oxidoreductase [Pseudoduganella flava]QGZ38110.1 GMC family oxidoreductase [Pseudoduganella flava]TWI50376.1 choline dehydrogenase-like flavoprotein [Pseudoduganella flava]